MNVEGGKIHSSVHNKGSHKVGSEHGRRTGFKAGQRREQETKRRGIRRRRIQEKKVSQESWRGHMRGGPRSGWRGLVTPRTDFREMKGAEFQARAGIGMPVAGGEEIGEEGAGQQLVRR